MRDHWMKVKRPGFAIWLGLCASAGPACSENGEQEPGTSAGGSAGAATTIGGNGALATGGGGLDATGGTGAVAGTGSGSGDSGAGNVGPAGGTGSGATSSGGSTSGGGTSGGSGTGAADSGGDTGSGGSSASGGVAGTGNTAGGVTGGASGTGSGPSGGGSGGLPTGGGTSGQGGSPPGGSSGSAGSSGSGGIPTGGTGGTAGGAGETGVRVSGRDLLVDGVRFQIRGVCWNPVPRGETHPNGLDYAGFVVQDGMLMQQAGINAVRTYEPIENWAASYLAVLDELHARGIYVLYTVYPYGGDPASNVTARVNAVKDHPAILMWVIGNEWNYNGLYVDLPLDDARARLNEVAALIKQADSSHPVATVYGEVPDSATVDSMPDVDVWGINVYSGDTFGTRLADWATVSSKPMFVAEYGADAYNANENQVDEASQAHATRVLSQEILDHSDPCIGGTIFEWADEWWKAEGSPSTQDTGGIAPGGGPYPDQTFNEEFWGLVDIDRTPRPAYDELATLYAGGN